MKREQLRTRKTTSGCIILLGSTHDLPERLVVQVTTALSDKGALHRGREVLHILEDSFMALIDNRAKVRVVLIAFNRIHKFAELLCVRCMMFIMVSSHSVSTNGGLKGLVRIRQRGDRALERRLCNICTSSQRQQAKHLQESWK